MTPLPSVALKCEYLVLLHTVESDYPWETIVATLGSLGTSARTCVPDRLLPSLLFVKGEPEGSLRLTQQAFANWLEQSDLPRWKRTKLASRFGFRTPPSKPGRLSAPELESLIMSFDLARSWLPALSQFEEAVDREAARRAALRLTLAAQRYRRHHGDWPVKLEDLVPDFIDKLPSDPFGKSGESLQLKRDGDELLIYSLGPNEVDDGGKVEHDHGSPVDEGFRVKPPE